MAIENTWPTVEENHEVSTLLSALEGNLGLRFEGVEDEGVERIHLKGFGTIATMTLGYDKEGKPSFMSINTEKEVDGKPANHEFYSVTVPTRGITFLGDPDPKNKNMERVQEDFSNIAKAISLVARLSGVPNPSEVVGLMESKHMGTEGALNNWIEKYPTWKPFFVAFVSSARSLALLK